MGRTPRATGDGYDWYYNDGTRLGEIQVHPGRLAPRKVCIAVQKDEAEQFDTADEAGRAQMIKYLYKRLQEMRARRRQ